MFYLLLVSDFIIFKSKRTKNTMAFKRIFIFSFNRMVYSKICIPSINIEINWCSSTCLLSCNPLAWELRRLMELLGTGRLAVLLGNPPKEFRATSTTISQLVDTAGKLSQNRKSLIVVDLGSDLRPEDFYIQEQILMHNYQLTF